MKNVIYKIRNIVNGKFYVGSTVDARVRFQSHKRRLKKGTHQSPHLQAAWDKYGEECFKFEVVEVVEDPANLLAAEQVWLDAHAGKDYCYNWATDASAPMRGKKHTPEVVEKLKIAGQKVPKGEASVLYGVPRSDETKAKISAKCKGIPNRMKGRQHSEQSRANMAAAVKRGEDHHSWGKPPTNLEELKRPILAILPDRSERIFESLSALRDEIGVAIGTTIRACNSGKPIQFGEAAGWVLSYADGEKNEAPEIPEEYLAYPRTRKDAKATGAKYYFTGLPCDRGHIAPRKTKGCCVDCMKEDRKKDNDRRSKKNDIKTTCNGTGQ